MITRPTVFILGAGASVPYGLPTGKELTEKVCRGVWTGTYVQEFGASGALQGTATNKAITMANMLNRSSLSIDTWLAQNEEYRDLGRFFITKAIAECENEDALNKTWEYKHKDWYGELWQWLNPPKLQDLSKNKVTFITFNYDRSLEQALMIKARNSFGGATESDCVNEIKDIPIIHLHGQIGHLPWQVYLQDRIDTVREYEPKIEPGWIWPCAKHIKIISETSPDTWEYKEARKAIKEADRIHFIGFGFNEDNMDRLCFGKPAGPMYATATCEELEHWKTAALHSADNPLGYPVATDQRFRDATGYARNMVEGWTKVPSPTRTEVRTKGGPPANENDQDGGRITDPATLKD